MPRTLSKHQVKALEAISTGKDVNQIPSSSVDALLRRGIVERDGAGIRPTELGWRFLQTGGV